MTKIINQRNAERASAVRLTGLDEMHNGAAMAQRTLKDRLKEVTALYDDGMISIDEYTAALKRILEPV
jgi:hypothetical protein